MVEAIKWILLGLGIGVAVEYARHIASLKQLLKLPDFQAQYEQATNKNLSLESLVPSLKADIESHLKTITQLESDLKTKPRASEVAAVAENPIVTASLDEMSSLSPQFRVMLIQAGVASPNELAAKTESELLEIVQAQPWDLVNPGEWIAEAKALTSGREMPESVDTNSDDLSDLPNITRQQSLALQNSAFATFLAISKASESQLLEAVEAMPWDIVNPQEWISYAKAHA